MAYFDLFPDVLLPSHSSKRNSNKDFVRVKNLFKRGKIREDFFQNATTFNKYAIIGDERPDQVAYKLYKDQTLDWVVMLSNNMINVRDEWPMSQYDFQRYLDNKYDKVQLSQIHHYETEEIRQPDGMLILQAGLHVDANFTYKYSYIGKQYSVNNVTGVINFEHEVKKNDEKRSIYIIRNEYLNVIIEDMRDIMTYEDSSQYIDDRTKKGDNLRILSPR